MARKVSVAGSVVRTWALSDEGQEFLTKFAEEKDMEVPTVGTRGKFSGSLLDAFHKANPKSRYEVGHVPTRQISGTRVTSNGRKIPVKVNATLAEVREWATSKEAKAQGIEVGSRGRISAEVYAAFAATPRG